MATIHVCDLCGEQIPEGAWYRVFLGPIGSAEDTGGRNQQFAFHGKVGPDGKSCYAVFLDALEDALRNTEAPARPISREERYRLDKEAEARWFDLSLADRHRFILEVLGTERLTVTQITERLDALREDWKVWRSSVTQTLTRLFERGDLCRESELYRNRPRYRYFFQPADLSGPIADLERMFREGDDRG
jgi:predicted transcriptional regulator